MLRTSATGSELQQSSGTGHANEKKYLQATVDEGGNWRIFNPTSN